MEKGGWVYIMTNKRYGVLYVGVTANLAVRIAQHREGKGGAFTRKYKLKLLVCYEHHASIEEAITREKQIKAWQRMWRVQLIEGMNPSWDDLWENLNG